MASTNFGASIVPTVTQNKADIDAILPPPTLDSPTLTPAVSHESLTPSVTNKGIPPHSPFYQHPPASFERAASRPSTSHNANEKDVEANVTEALAPGEEHDPFTSQVNLDSTKECRMWPSKQNIAQSRKADIKRKRESKFMRGCGPVRDVWSRFNKRQRLYIKIAFALFIIGVIVAIAVGISVAVNGTVYSGTGQSHQIPDPNDNN